VSRFEFANLLQVLKKTLKAVEQLPICADDLHLTRSAHGTFADMLQHLTCHPEPEVSTQTRGPGREVAAVHGLCSSFRSYLRSYLSWGLLVCRGRVVPACDASQAVAPPDTARLMRAMA